VLSVEDELQLGEGDIESHLPGCCKNWLNIACMCTCSEPAARDAFNKQSCKISRKAIERFGTGPQMREHFGWGKEGLRKGRREDLLSQLLLGLHL
jgi:hypothetical protein